MHGQGVLERSMFSIVGESNAEGSSQVLDDHAAKRVKVALRVAMHSRVLQVPVILLHSPYLAHN